MLAKNIAEWRKLVLERDNHTCRICGTTTNITSHHIKQKSLYPNLFLEIDNGETRCKSCHRLAYVDTGRDKIRKSRWILGTHSDFLGIRKLIKVGNSRAVVIPPDWIRYYEEKHGYPISEILMELNNIITIAVDEPKEEVPKEVVIPQK